MRYYDVRCHKRGWKHGFSFRDSYLRGVPVSTCSENASVVHLPFLPAHVGYAASIAGRRYPFILILVHIQDVLETQEVDSVLRVERYGFIRNGTYPATRSIFVLSLVRHDSQLIRSIISMTCGSEQPPAVYFNKELQA